MPTPAHLYVLVAGIFLGIALSPAILGRLSPATYDGLFLGGGEAAAELRREEAALQAHAELLQGAGATGVAAEELMLRETERLAPLRVQVDLATREREATVRGWIFALVAALAGVMVAETLLSPNTRRLPGLVTARYALLALLVALAIAKPALFGQIPLILAGGLFVVALAAAWVPLRRRTAAAT